MRFYLFSTDDTDPALASDVTEWALDVVEGEYDSEFEWGGRGAAITTLGGRFVQDYGVEESDRKIRVAGADLDSTERAALDTKWSATNTEWHFTARKAAAIATEVWRVRFQRVPRGFTAVLDAPVFAIGRLYSEPPAPLYERYRYELVLLVSAKVYP